MSLYTEIFTGKNSSKKLPFLILICIPLSLSIGLFISDIVSNEFYLAFFFGGAAYLFVALVFGLYPLRYGTSIYFKKRGYEKGIVEFEFVRTIVYLLIPTLIVIGAFYIIDEDITFEDTLPLHPFGDFTIILSIVISSIIGGLLWIIIQSRKKEFGFYFGKAFIEIASKENDETKRANYFINGVKFYDKYLQRSLNLQINNIKEIYSKVIIDSNIDKKEVIDSLSLAFETDNDRLKPAKCLFDIANVSDTKKFLIEESIGKKLKDLIIFYVTIIPVAIAIIQLLLLLKGGTGTPPEIQP
jgi:hypothetical protein